jgi:hypothetical protein
MNKNILVCAALLLSACGGESPQSPQKTAAFATSGAQRARVAVPSAVPGERRAYNIVWTENKELIGTSTTPSLADFRLTAPQVRLQDISLNFDKEGVGGQLYRLYQAAFGRIPDVRGFGYWKDAMEKNGLTLSEVANAFVASAESTALYGSTSDDATFVNRLYQNVLRRAGDPAGLSYWAGVLRSGTPRADVLLAFADSAENRNATAATTSGGMAFAEPGIPYIPVSNASGPTDVPVGIAIEVDGSTSTDANDDRLTYAWSVTNKPAFSSATFTAANIARPPIKFDLPGTYQITLWTNDGTANSYSPAQLVVVAHGIVADSGTYTCSSIDAGKAASLYSLGHTYLDRDKDGKACTAADVAFERSPPVAVVPDSGTFKCSTISHEYAVLLYLQGHTYLDRDHDGKPCEATDLTVEKNTYTPPAPLPAPKMCYVNGYTRKDGTHVNGYWRRC